MSQTYQSRRRAQDAPAANKSQTAVPGPSLQELAAGAMPSAEQMGRRVDLPEAVREKMESSFGADFSNVKLFESQTVAQAGAEAMTQGQNIAFAPGRLDLASTAGQALLGHELSHVVSQARGESAGHGFLADSGLEAQADRQGLLAAQGESVYSGPVTPIGASSAAAASGPMQAKKTKDIAKEGLARGESAKENAKYAFSDAWSSLDLERSEARSRTQRGAGTYNFEDNSPKLVPGTEEYLNMGLDGKSLDERMEFMRAFTTDSKDSAAMARLIAGEVARYNAMDFSSLVSDDVNVRSEAMGKTANSAKSMKALSDMIRNLRNSVQGIPRMMYLSSAGLDQDALDSFHRRAEEVGQDALVAQEGLEDLAGGKPGGTYASSRSRKAYRKARREGISGVEAKESSGWKSSEELEEERRQKEERKKRPKFLDEIEANMYNEDNWNWN